MFLLIFGNRWSEHIYKLKVVPKHSKYASAQGCPKKEGGGAQLKGQSHCMSAWKLCTEYSVIIQQQTKCNKVCVCLCVFVPGCLKKQLPS